MKGLGISVLVLVFGAVLGMLIEKTAEIVLTGQSYQFFTKVYGGIGVHPISFNITVAGVIGLIASYLLIVRVIHIFK